MIALPICTILLQVLSEVKNAPVHSPAFALMLIFAELFDTLIKSLDLINVFPITETSVESLISIHVIVCDDSFCLNSSLNVFPHIAVFRHLLRTTILPFGNMWRVSLR